MAEEVFRHLPFPFADDVFPRQLGAAVHRTVLDGVMPAREVIHTVDNSWIVGDGSSDPNAPGGLLVANIWHVIDQNSSVAALASLRPGQAARRDGPGAPWRITEHHFQEDE